MRSPSARRASVAVALAAAFAFGLAVSPASADPANTVTTSGAAGLVDAGQVHTCAVGATRRVRCWGYGFSGRLGNNATSNIGGSAGSMGAMVDLPLPSDVAQVSAVGEGTCALLTDGKVRCWGSSASGALGVFSTSNVGDNATTRRLQDGPVVPLPGPARQLSSGSVHTCALLRDGKVYCWGRNSEGQAGIDSDQDVYGNLSGGIGPAILPAKAIAVAAGGSNTCAILETRKLRCWGEDSLGQLGLDSGTMIGTPGAPMADAPDVAVPGDVLAVAVGGTHTCAIYRPAAPGALRKLRCWGYNFSGQLGTDSTSDVTGGVAGAPDAILPAEPISVSAGSEHTCVALATGKVRCFGHGFSGQLGTDAQADIGDAPGSMAAASDVPLPAPAVQVIVGGSHSCALLTTGRLRCWGSNFLGQLGNDTTTNVGDAPGTMAAASDLTLPSVPTDVADLDLDASIDASAAPPGGSATVTVSVTNRGPSAAGSVVVAAPLPTGMTPGTVIATQGSWAAGTWTVGAVAAGATVTLQLQAVMPANARGVQRSAVYEVQSSGRTDPDSIPGDGLDGDDRAGVSILTSRPSGATETPRIPDATFQFADGFGAAGSGPGQFSSPVDLAIDTTDSFPMLYVSDFGNSRVQAFANFTHRYDIGTYGPGVGQLRGPLGLAVRDERLWVVDSGAFLSGRVQSFDVDVAAATYRTTFATAGSLDFPGSSNLPSDVAVDAWDGQVHVTDRPFKPVQEFDGDGTFRRQYGANFDAADGIVVNDATGKVYVSDTQNGRIQVYDQDGTFLSSIGSPGSGAGQLDTPRGLAIDPFLRVLFVADSGNDRIQVFSLTGTHLASFGSTGAADGQFEEPQGVAVNTKDGSVYVADTGNNRIQRFTRVVPPPPPPPPDDPPASGGSTTPGTTPAPGGTSTTPGATPPPPPPTTTASCPATAPLRDVVVGLAKVRGCLASLPGGRFRADNAIRLNGVPLTVSNRRWIVDTEKKTLQLDTAGSVFIALDGKTIWSGELPPLKLPDITTADGEKSLLPTKLKAKGTIYGLKLGGDFDMKLGREGGRYYASFQLTVGLPEIFSYPSDPNGTKGGVTSTVAVRVDEGGRVNSNGVNFTVRDLRMGPLTAREVCFALLPSSSTVAECTPPAIRSFSREPLDESTDEAFLTCKPDRAVGNRWSASVVLELPTPSKTTIGAFGSGTDDKLRSLGGWGDNLGIPIANGVSLETLGAGVCVPTATNPELAIKGTVGVGVVSTGSGPLVKVTGSITYRGRTRPPMTWSLSFDGDVAIKAFGRIGAGSITINNNGTFGAGVELSRNVLGVFIITGKVKGWYEPPTQAFTVEGNVELCLGTLCTGGGGFVSNKGIAGCAYSSWGAAGVGYTWGSKEVTFIAGTCSYDPWRPRPQARADGTPGALQVAARAGDRSIAFRATGTTAPPGLLVAAPDGSKTEIPAGQALQRTADRVVFLNDQDRTTNVALGNVKPGTYTVTPLDPDNPVTGYATAQQVATFTGKGTVRPGPIGRRTLDVRYVVPDGATVRLADVARRGGEVVAQRTIAASLKGRACPKPRRVSGGTERCARVVFTPADGPAGPREIVALVTRDGMPVATETVARHTTSAPAPLARPASVQLIRRGSTVTARFTPVRGATEVAVLVRPSSGAPASFVVPAGCRAVAVRGVARGTAVSATVAGIRFDGVTGARATARLQPKAARGGGRGAVLRGTACEQR